MTFSVYIFNKIRSIHRFDAQKSNHFSNSQTIFFTETSPATLGLKCVITNARCLRTFVKITGNERRNP